ncbi:unnamed protein product [Effrenium voratum]|nr:unnamed protein product [Effrenium voratum]
MLATLEGGNHLVQILAEQRAQLTKKDQRGWTPLFHAASEGNVDLVKWLLRKHCSAQDVDKDRHTALMVAYNAPNNTKVAHHLLKRACSVNAQNDAGDSVLMMALRNDQTLEFARWLQNDPFLDVLLKNAGKEDAIDICEQRGLYGMRLMLESKARLQAEEQADKEKAASSQMAAAMDGTSGRGALVDAADRLKQLKALQLEEKQQSVQELLSSCKRRLQQLLEEILPGEPETRESRVRGMPGSHHGEDAEEEEQVAVTASHRSRLGLELAIPVEEEVDINVLLPLLNGFKAPPDRRIADSRKAKEPPEADGSPTNSKFVVAPAVRKWSWSSREANRDSSLWSTLEELLEIDRKGIEELAARECSSSAIAAFPFLAGRGKMFFALPEAQLIEYEEGDQVMEEGICSRPIQLQEMMGSFEPGWREAFTRGETFMRGETFVRGQGIMHRKGCVMLVFALMQQRESELAAKLREEERELRVTKAHERALEVDFQAKEKLVQNLMEERKDLRAKTMELEHALEHSGRMGTGGWFQMCGAMALFLWRAQRFAGLSGLSALLGKKESPGREVLDTINEAEEEKDVEKAMERAISSSCPDASADPAEYSQEEDVFVHLRTGIRVWAYALDLRDGSESAVLYYYTDLRTFEMLTCQRDQGIEVLASAGKELPKGLGHGILATRFSPEHWASQEEVLQSFWPGEADGQAEYCVPIMCAAASESQSNVWAITLHGGVAKARPVEGMEDGQLEAEMLYLETLERSRQLGLARPEDLAQIHQLATELKRKQRLKAAERFFREALEGREELLGPSHRDTVSSLQALAEVLQLQGSALEAERLWRRAVQRLERSLGKDHPETLRGLHGLAEALLEQGKLSESKEYFQSSYQLRKQKLGDHAETQQSLDGLERACRALLEEKRKTLGPEHPETCAYLTILARLLHAAGTKRQLQEAELLYHEAFEGERERSGYDHPETLTHLTCLGKVLLAQDCVAEAGECFSAAFARRRLGLGLDHPDTQESLRMWVQVLQDLGRHEDAERLQAHIWSSRPPSQLELAWWPRLEVEQLLPFQACQRRKEQDLRTPAAVF